MPIAPPTSPLIDLVYNDANSNLGDTISHLADRKAGYVAMPSSFFNVPLSEGGRSYFSMTHEATGTSRIVQGKRRMKMLMESGDYIDASKAFQALQPGQGIVHFYRYFNSSTGAYGYSELQADADLFESAGYQSDGIAWSV